MFSPYSIFMLDSDPSRNDQKLRLRVRCSEWVINFNVGFRVNVDKWNRETQRCLNGTTHGAAKTPASVINREISRHERLLQELVNSYQRDGLLPDRTKFKEDFSRLLGRPEKKKMQTAGDAGLFDRFDEFVASEGYLNSWGESLNKKFGTFRNHLHAFRPDLSFDVLTDFVLTDFVNYLHGCGLRNISVDKMLRYLRWFLRWANGKGYYNGRLHETFKPRLKGADGSSKVVIYLTWDELSRFNNFDFASCDIPVEQQKALARVRDVFCFQCFSSLRYSDVAKLKRSDIRDGAIHVVTQKTLDSLSIELNEYSRAILEKYADIALPNDQALPVISNQKMNDQLKVAAELAGLDSPQRVVYFARSERFEEVVPLHSIISTHCGRRTFVVTALYLGVPAEVIMAWTGHKNFASMKPYMKIVNELKAREMKKFNRE